MSRVADKLRGYFKPHEYGSVMLVLRRMGTMLEPTTAAVLARAQKLEHQQIGNVDPILRRAVGQSLYNVSPLTLTTLLREEKDASADRRAYVNGFSPAAVEVIEESRRQDHPDSRGPRAVPRRTAPVGCVSTIECQWLPIA